MFHLKIHRKAFTYSHNWLEQLEGKVLNKRVVGKTETKPYYRRKLATSVHAACMKSFGFSGEAELTALRVCKDVEQWLENKEEVTKADIRRIAAAALKKYNPRAAYEYLPVKEYVVKEDEYGYVRL